MSANAWEKGGWQGVHTMECRAGGAKKPSGHVTLRRGRVYWRQEQGKVSGLSAFCRGGVPDTWPTRRHSHYCIEQLHDSLPSAITLKDMSNYDISSNVCSIPPERSSVRSAPASIHEYTDIPSQVQVCTYRLSTSPIHTKQDGGDEQSHNLTKARAEARELPGPRAVGEFR